MEGRCTHTENLSFNGRPCMKMNVPENADLMLFFGLMLIDDLVEDLVKKTNKYADKTIIKN